MKIVAIGINIGVVLYAIHAACKATVDQDMKLLAYSIFVGLMCSYLAYTVWSRKR